MHLYTIFTIPASSGNLTSIFDSTTPRIPQNRNPKIDTAGIKHLIGSQGQWKTVDPEHDFHLNL